MRYGYVTSVPACCRIDGDGHRPMLMLGEEARRPFSRPRCGHTGLGSIILRFIFSSMVQTFIECEDVISFPTKHIEFPTKLAVPYKMWWFPTQYGGFLQKPGMQSTCTDLHCFPHVQHRFIYSLCSICLERSLGGHFGTCMSLLYERNVQFAGSRDNQSAGNRDVQNSVQGNYPP